MKKIIIALIMLSIFACNKEESNEKNDTAISLDFTISVSDKDGLDLLDPSNKNSFPHDKISIYEIDKKGEKYIQKTDITNEGLPFYVISLFVGYKEGETINNFSKGTSIIELSKGNIEKIEYEIKYSENSALLDKLWYKGKKIYDISIPNTGNHIKIIK